MTAGHQRRRYLDAAATSWPKPDTVLDAWNDATRRIGATAGRAAYREALEADAVRERARRAVAGLLGGVDPRRVAMPLGCTLALNQAIHGLLRAGDHVVATAADHNATLRPLHHMARHGMITLSIVPCDGAGRVDPDDVARAWTPATRWLVFSHASNVTGAVHDVATLAAIAHARGGLVVLDAAQTLGVVQCSAPGFGADVVVAPAHKWLQGTAGVAVLWARDGVDIAPMIQGGTGSTSESLDMPDIMVERLEAGTPDVPALAALQAAADWVASRGLIGTGGGLAADAAERLAAVKGVRVMAAPGVPIVSFVVEGYAPADVAAIMELSAGAQVRAGYHCAACVHEHLGTRDAGTVRASFGPFTTSDDVDAVVGAVEAIA